MNYSVLASIFAKNRYFAMVTIKVHTPIDSEAANRWLAACNGGDDMVFSLESVQRIFAENPDETDFRFDIHCDGGSVLEGLAIYDFLRGSGKNIWTNIEGGCHSMAVVLLLAAPKENRTANANARALIHEVQIPVEGEMLSTSELESLQDEAKREQDTILNIYADRTGTDRETLAALMAEEKIRTAAELLKYGFIGKINIYNTNSKKMNKSKKVLVNQIDKLMRGIKNVLGGVNYDFTDAEGNVILSTEREDETIEIGDAVILPDGAVDGEVTLADGRTIVVAAGVVTEIREKEEGAAAEPETEPVADEPVEGENEVSEEKIAELEARIAALEEKLAAANTLLKEARNSIASNYEPAGRNFRSQGEQNVNDLKEAVRAKLRK